MDGPPPRTNQIQFKAAAEVREEGALRTVAGEVQELWAAFVAHHNDVEPFVVVQTWRQRQKDVVAPIEAQRVIFILVFAIVSSVSIVLIFVIFYMMVLQKTRDIGVLKAIGASSKGVAGIFLAYGAAIGLAGAVLGVLGGYAVVRNINPIHDWLGRVTGVYFWSRETFMFDTIPNEIGGTSTVLIALASVAAGLLGALVPAIRAATMQPVRALRYE
jgi:lipoprotein-releasing system permease protein